jgi:uncharacterized membrane protein
MLPSRKIVALLGLLLLAVALFTPSTAQDVFFVLPVFVTLFFVLVPVDFVGAIESLESRLDPALGPVSLRAPPLQ